MSEVLPWIKAGLAVFSTIVTEAVLTPAQAEAMATVLAEMECDPTPCRPVRDFRELAEPRYPRRVAYRADMLSGLFEGRFSDALVPHFQRGIDALGRVPALELAVFETVCRRHAARQAHDRGAEQRQLEHRRSLIAATAEAKRETADAFRGLLAELRRAGVRSREIPVAERLPALRRAFQAGELPELEVQILSDYGIEGERLRRVLDFVIRRVEPEDVPTTFEEFARGLIGVMRWNTDIEECDCAAAATVGAAARES